MCMDAKFLYIEIFWFFYWLDNDDGTHNIDFNMGNHVVIIFYVW